MSQKTVLQTDHIYHIFNRSIAQYTIFNTPAEYLRMTQAIQHYQTVNPIKLSYHLRNIAASIDTDPPQEKETTVTILAFCLMPNHYHFILRQNKDNGISHFIKDIQGSYTQYFNLKHKRKGPLWEGRFKRVLVETNEQLAHLTRYIHLNPTTANIVKKPQDWAYSSYFNYITTSRPFSDIKHALHLLNMTPMNYKKFTEEGIDYQKSRKKP